MCVSHWIETNDKDDHGGKTEKQKSVTGKGKKGRRGEIKGGEEKTGGREYIRKTYTNEMFLNDSEMINQLQKQNICYFDLLTHFLDSLESALIKYTGLTSVFSRQYRICKCLFSFIVSNLQIPAL